MSIPWYLAALGAAVIWGIHYPLIGNALRTVSPVSVLLLSVAPIVLIVPWFHREILADCRALLALDWSSRAAILSIAATSTLATVLLLLSIGSKNATLASLVEISYPLFVALFTFVIFRENHMTASALAGGALILAGVALIALNNG